MITTTQLKKSIEHCTQDEYSELIIEIAQSCPQAREFLTVKFADTENINEIFEKYKQKVEYEFFPKRGYGRLNLREAKKAISDFRKISPDKAMTTDLMLFYVENCLKYTDSYGDINESFYNSAVSVYNQVMKNINSDKRLYTIFARRLKSAAENACEGWGFKDDMITSYYEIVWLDETEE